MPVSAAELAIGKGMDGETRWMFHESVQQTKFRAKTSMYSVYVGYLPLSATAVRTDIIPTSKHRET